MVMLKKVHLVIGVLSLLIPPFIGVLTGYIDLKTQFQSIRLEVEKEYVRKDEIGSLRSKIDKIAEDVAEIKGAIKGRYRAGARGSDQALAAHEGNKQPNHN